MNLLIFEKHIFIVVRPESLRKDTLEHMYNVLVGNEIIRLYFSLCK